MAAVCNMTPPPPPAPESHLPLFEGYAYFAFHVASICFHNCSLVVFYLLSAFDLLDFLSHIMFRDIVLSPTTTQTQKYNKTDILSILRKILQRMCTLNQ